ncbi:MAG TPA: VWA domain-containing protein, partial [Enhygromyxa sp.]|nr:VWA domain-containing protein [Enhygromyxa sp.]
ELTVMLLVDMSASLDFGSTEADKRNLVARLAATFAFSAIRNNDRVGLIGFTDAVEVFVPPRSGRKHVLAVVQNILTHRTRSRETNLSVPLETMAQMGRRHAVVILISDFIDAGLAGDRGRPPYGRALGEGAAANAAEPGVGRAEGRFERALKLVRRRNDVIPVRVEDPIELALPNLGLIAVEDLELLERGGIRLIDLGGRRAKRYREQVAREREAFDRLMNRLRLETMTIRCGENWEKPLVGFFERRARRMRR